MPRTYGHYVLISHRTEPRILLLADDVGHALPRYEVSEGHYWQDVSAVNEMVNAAFGVRVVTLRCIETHFDGEEITLFYAMDGSLIPVDWTPPSGAVWASEAELDDVPTGQDVIIKDWFAWMRTQASLTCEWYQAGWYGKTVAWIESQFDDRGIMLTAPVEQMRSWERSAILRMETTHGRYYFKAVPKVFKHEPALVKWLAYTYPDDFPRPLVVDGWRRWLLMPDYGSQTLDRVTEIDRWEAALRRYAELQISMSVRTNDLIGLGCPDRRLYRLPDTLERLLQSGVDALSGSSLSITEDELTGLRSRIPEFKQACTELMAYSIPSSLEHGDFWAGQVVMNGDKQVFIDWSDCSVSHPFFSLYFLTDADIQLPDVPNARERLRDAYLKPWQAYEPLAKLIEAYDVAMRVAPLHHAVIYQQQILPEMENQWEMNNMIVFYLRRLLA